MPTAGNAGPTWAAYGSRVGLRVVVIMPETTPSVIRREAAACGAEVYLVSGSIADAGAVVREGCRRYGWYDASTLKEPYWVEGKKTMGFELVDQLGWRLPGVIVYPTGGGVGLIGMWKGFQELRGLGWLPAGWPLPRFVAAQAAGCAPVVRAFAEHAERTVAWEDLVTFAAGVRVPKPLGDFLILRALRETSGTALAVPDDCSSAHKDPPMNEPITLSSTVPRQPIGSRPGTRKRATAPTGSPTTIHETRARLPRSSNYLQRFADSADTQGQCQRLIGLRSLGVVSRRS